MHDLVVYLGTLPKIKNRSAKVDILNNFAAGAKAKGANVKITTDRQLHRSKLAVMIGWYGQKISGPHIQFRKQLIEHQLTNNNHIMPIDGSCFKWADSNDTWLRYSLDSVFYNEGNYANQNPTTKKWKQIRSTLNIDSVEWRDSGNHILLCLQRDNGWQGKGFDQQKWVSNTINKLKQHTDRKIVLRCHPGSISDTRSFENMPDVTVSNCLQNTIMQDLKNAHAGVFYNSSSSVACALAGIPVFACEPSAVTWEIANKDLGKIETPDMPNKTQWLYKLANAHWSTSQSCNGEIWNAFKEYL